MAAKETSAPSPDSLDEELDALVGSQPTASDGEPVRSFDEEPVRSFEDEKPTDDARRLSDPGVGAVFRRSSSPPGFERSADGRPQPGDLDAHAQDLIELCRMEQARGADPHKVAKLQFEAARMHEAMSNPATALEQYRGAVQELPQHLPSVRGMRRALLALGRYEEALPWFDAELRLLTHPADKASVLYRKGLVLDDRLSRAEDARACYESALELEPRNLAILKAVERFADELSPARRLKLQEQIAELLETDSGVQSAYLCRAAREAEARGELERAISLFERAWKGNNRTLRAVDGLKRLYHAQSRWTELASLHLAEAELFDPTRRVEASLVAARMFRDRVGDRARAVEAAEQAMEALRDGSGVPVREGLQPETVATLAELYEQTHQWERFAEVLEPLANMSEGEVAAAAWFRLGRVHAEQRQDMNQAVRCYERALSFTPGNGDRAEILAALHADRKEWVEQIAVLNRWARHVESPLDRAEIHARAARVAEVHKGDRELATELHFSALAQVPNFRPSYRALCRLLPHLERWRELVELLDAEVQRVRDRDESLAISTLLEIGHLYDHVINEPVEAMHAYKRILEICPGHVGALRSWQRAAEQAGRGRELVEALLAEHGSKPAATVEGRMTRDRGDAPAELLHRAGQVLNDELGDRAAAEDMLRRALSLCDTPKPILATLGSMFLRENRWEDLIAVRKQQLACAPESERVNWYLNMGHIAMEHMRRPSLAVEHYLDAHKLEPGHRDVIEPLEELLTELGREDELVGVIERAIKHSKEPSWVAHLCMRLAMLLEQREAPAEQCMKVYARALREQNSLKEARDAIRRLQASAHMWKELARDLHQDAEQAPDARDRAAALVVEGEVRAYQLQDRRGAARCFEAALELEPGHHGALVELESLYWSLQDWEALARVLREQSIVWSAPGARAESYRGLARLVRLERSEAKTDLANSYKSVVALGGWDRETVDELEALALERGDAHMIVEVDRLFLDQETDAVVRAAHLTRLGEALEKVQDFDGSLKSYKAALEHDPESLASARGMRRLAGMSDNAFTIAEAARREAKLIGEPDRAADLLVECAKIHVKRLSDPEGAQRDLEHALERSPGHKVAVNALVTLLTSRKRHGRLIEILSRTAHLTQDRSRKAQVWLRIATVQHDAQGNLSAAVTSLKRALESLPEETALLERLAEYCCEDAQWAEAVRLFTELLRRGPTEERSLEYRIRLAVILEEHLDDTARAMTYLKEVLEMRPTHGEALRRVARLHRSQGRHHEAIAALTTLVRETKEPREKAEALVSLGELALESDSRDEAVSHFLNAVSVEGPFGSASQQLRTLSLQTQGWSKLVSAMERFAKGPVAGADRDLLVRTMVEVARVKQDQLNDGPQAIDLLRRTLETYPDFATFLRTQLARALNGAGQHQEAANLLMQVLDVNVDRADLWRELAHTFRTLEQPVFERLSLMPLQVLEPLLAEEREVMKQAPPRPAEALSGSLRMEELITRSGFEGPENVAIEMLQLLSDALGKLYPVELESYGLSHRDRVTSRMNIPLRDLVEKLGSIVGAPNFEFYIHNNRAQGVCVEVGSPPVLLVPASIEQLPRSVQVFRLSQPISLMAQRLHATQKLTPRELEVLLAAAARSVAPRYGAMLTSEEFLVEQNRLIMRTLPRKSRKRIEELALAYVKNPFVDFLQFTTNIRQASLRISSLLSDDLVGCVRALAEEDRDLREASGSELVAKSSVIADLMRFWMSDFANTMRKHIGLL